MSSNQSRRVLQDSNSSNDISGELEEDEDLVDGENEQVERKVEMSNTPMEYDQNPVQDSSDNE